MMAIFAIYLSGVIFMLIVGLLLNKYYHSSSKIGLELALTSWFFPAFLILFIAVYLPFAFFAKLFEIIKIEEYMQKLNKWYKNK